MEDPNSKMFVVFKNEVVDCSFLDKNIQIVMFQVFSLDFFHSRF